MKCPKGEINFPTVGPGDVGEIWCDPVVDICYIWDGIKWDIVVDVDDEAPTHWVRNIPEQRLTPRDPDDTIRTSGYEFAWLKNLKDAPDWGMED